MVFKILLKFSVVSDEEMGTFPSTMMLFHSRGAAFAKALPPTFVDRYLCSVSMPSF